jgi:hypothetical protein
MNTIDNQNLRDNFRLRLGRLAILLAPVGSFEGEGGFRLIDRIFCVSLAFCCWSCSIRPWLCRISASNLAIDFPNGRLRQRSRLIFLGLLEPTFFPGGCGSGTHPIPKFR